MQRSSPGETRCAGLIGGGGKEVGYLGEIARAADYLDGYLLV